MTKKSKLYILIFIFVFALPLILSGCDVGDLVLGGGWVEQCCGGLSFIGAPILMMMVTKKYS